MPRAGRKSKPGKRHPCGKRLPDPRIVRGNDRAEERKRLFGNHATTALGRAYAAGMLGDEADSLYAAGKRFVRVYSRLIDPARYRCALDDTPRGRDDNDTHEQDMHDQSWLFGALARLEKAHMRAWLDLLLLDAYHDSDPPFLARLLAGGKNPVDRAMLGRCITAMGIVDNPQRSC